MGLAVSQVRLLALTTRKADIELRMQVNSKRKQMLTRKSTELAQQYYSRLQDASVQYATSAGYEDVNYNYLMGETANGAYTNDFWQKIAVNSSELTKKIDSRMVLTDQYGQVVVNNEMAIAVQKAQDQFSNYTVGQQAANAIWELLDSNQGASDAMSSLWQALNATSIGRNEAVKYIELMLKNGGYQSGGTVYVTKLTNPDGSINTNLGGGRTFYATDSAAKAGGDRDVVKLQAGYCYTVLDHTHAHVGTNASNHFYDGSKFTTLTTQNAKYLGNIINYFGPILTAALQNGTTGTEDAIKARKYDSTKFQLFDANHNPTTDVTKAVYYKQKTGATWGPEGQIGDGTKVFDTYTLADGANAGFTRATNTAKLQAGFKSGTYQLCMVSDPYRGLYHKNTTLEYFTHMNYVVQKTDSSKREEITAWYNAEQAAISEQETYWDTEITNLSSELNAVTTEIDSVKSLKSNAIKSVFDWGGS